jgi:hypothetical protein
LLPSKRPLLLPEMKLMEKKVLELLLSMKMYMELTGLLAVMD